MSKEALRIENLSKVFRSYWTFLPRTALSSVSLTVNEGEIYGFLGHNGAGKTTTIRCILGLIKKDRGSIFLNGQELSHYSQRALLGYLPEQPYFYDHLSVHETLSFFAALCDIRGVERKRRVNETLLTVGLAERARDRVRSLSKGLQQRIALAQAIVNRPSLLLLDEPFSGLDPLGRAEFRKIILDLHREGTTIFISSHILPDIQEISSRAAILVKGTLKKEVVINELINPPNKAFLLSVPLGPEIVATPSSSDTLFQILPEGAREVLSRSSKQTFESRPGGVVVTFEFSDYFLASRATKVCLDNELKVERFGPKERQLEEVFIETTRG